MSLLPSLDIRLFGQLELEWGDIPLSPPRSSGARSLLAFLVTQASHSFPRDLLVGTFWPDRPDSRARRALSQALWQIRQVLHPAADRLVSNGDSVKWDPQPDDWLDVSAFEQKVTKYVGGQWARDLSARPLSNGLPELSEAVKLYRADFLQDCYDDWAMLERERLRELYLAGLEVLIVAHKQQGDYEEALAHAQRLVGADSLRESAHQELIRLYHLLGRDRAALEQYHTLRRVLADEMGVEPMAATEVLAQEITTHLGEMSPPYLPVVVRPAPIFDQPEMMPLMGRQEERANLLAHLEGAIDGHGGLVLIEGEAGVGKTRLLQEVARGAEWRGAKACWGRGREQAEMPPYNLLRESLLGALSPLRATQLREVEGEVWLREVSRVLPELVEWLPGLPPHITLEPEQQRARLQEALSRTIVALGSIMPHLLILDDLQWADEATLSALAHLLPELRESQVLVVGSYRGEEAREQPAIWEALQALDRAGGHQRLHLARLSAEQTGELVRRGLGLGGEVPLFEDRLYRETDGNPLFVLETLRALHDEGLLYRDAKGGWSTPWDETTTDYAELPLPTRISRVIARRLARLGANQRSVLNVAAVLGGDCSFTLLAQTTGLERSTVLKAVGGLLRRRLLVEEPMAYQFSHDKVRQVTYAQIGETEQRRLHNKAGRALETLQPDSVEELAYHFSLGQVWEKAVTYNRQAGERAKAVYAGVEAAGYYDRALEAWGHLPSPDQDLGMSLHQARGRVCQETGRFDQAEADFRTAHDLAAQMGDDNDQVRALNHLSYLQFQQGNFARAAETAQQALDMAPMAQGDHHLASALLNKANATRNLGHYRQALRLYKQAVTIFERLNDRMHLADTLNRMGYALLFVGNYSRAQSVMDRSLTIRRQLDDRVGIAYSLINLASLYHYLGQFDRVREVAQEALEVASAIDDPYGQDAALQCLGIAALEQGFSTQAVSFFERSLQIAREIGDQAIQPCILLGLVEAYHGAGDLKQAQEMLEESINMLPVSDERRLVPEAYALLAQFLLATDQYEEASALACHGLQVAQEIEEPWCLGLTYRVMGEVAAHVGHERVRAEPASHFEASIRVLREVGAQAELARSLAAYGLYLQGSAHNEKGHRSTLLLDEARRLFQRLGMTGDLNSLEAKVAAYLPPGRIRVRLPRSDAPIGRPLHDDEWVEVVWTVSTPEDDATINRPNPRKHSRKVIRRHRQLLRLMREAAEQEGAPTVADLAAALEISARTIERDLAMLRSAGHEIHTRGNSLFPKG